MEDKAHLQASGKHGHREVLGIDQAVVVDMPSPFSRPLLKLYCYCAAAFLSATMSGESDAPKLKRVFLV